VLNGKGYQNNALNGKRTGINGFCAGSRIRPWVRAISLFTAMIFFCQQLSFAQPQADTPTPAAVYGFMDLDQVSIPRDIAITKEVNHADSRELIINIRDVHDNFGAQESIVSVLDNLVVNYDLEFVGVEGSEGLIDMSLISAFPDAEARRAAAGHMMREGKISAGEFFTAVSDTPVKLYGIENSSLYLDNLNSFLDLLDSREHNMELVKSLRDALYLLEDHIFSEELKILNRNSVLNNNHGKGFTDRWRLVEEIGQEKGIDLSGYGNISSLIRAVKMESDVDYPMTNVQREAILDILAETLGRAQLEELVLKGLSYKLGRISKSQFYSYLLMLARSENVERSHYSELEKFCDYVNLYESIDIADLMDEIDEYESRVKKRLFRTEEEKELSFLIKDVEILSKAFAIELTNGQLRYFRENLENFNWPRFLGFITRQYSKYGLALPGEIADAAALFPQIPGAVDFYDTATARDKAMVENAIRDMRRNDITVGAIITGGFHTKGITDILRDRSASYIVLLPRFNPNTGERPYITVLTDRAKTYRNYVASGDYLAVTSFFSQAKNIIYGADMAAGSASVKRETVAIMLASAILRYIERGIVNPRVWNRLKEEYEDRYKAAQSGIEGLTRQQIDESVGMLSQMLDSIIVEGEREEVRVSVRGADGNYQYVVNKAEVREGEGPRIVLTAAFENVPEEAIKRIEMDQAIMVTEAAGRQALDAVTDIKKTEFFRRIEDMDIVDPEKLDGEVTNIARRLGMVDALEDADIKSEVSKIIAQKGTVKTAATPIIESADEERETDRTFRDGIDRAIEIAQGRVEVGKGTHAQALVMSAAREDQEIALGGIRSKGGIAVKLTESPEFVHSNRKGVFPANLAFDSDVLYGDAAEAAWRAAWESSGVSAADIPALSSHYRDNGIVVQERAIMTLAEAVDADMGDELRYTDSTGAEHRGASAIGAFLGELSVIADQTPDVRQPVVMDMESDIFENIGLDAGNNLRLIDKNSIRRDISDQDKRSVNADIMRSIARRLLARSSTAMGEAAAELDRITGEMPRLEQQRMMRNVVGSFDLARRAAENAEIADADLSREMISGLDTLSEKIADKQNDLTEASSKIRLEYLENTRKASLDALEVERLQKKLAEKGYSPELGESMASAMSALRASITAADISMNRFADHTAGLIDDLRSRIGDVQWAERRANYAFLVNEAVDLDKNKVALGNIEAVAARAEAELNRARGGSVQIGDIEDSLARLDEAARIAEGLISDTDKAAVVLQRREEMMVTIREARDNLEASERFLSVTLAGETDPGTLKKIEELRSRIASLDIQYGDISLRVASLDSVDTAADISSVIPGAWEKWLEGFAKQNQEELEKHLRKFAIDFQRAEIKDLLAKNDFAGIFSRLVGSVDKVTEAELLAYFTVAFHFSTFINQDNADITDVQKKLLTELREGNIGLASTAAGKTITAIMKFAYGRQMARQGDNNYSGVYLAESPSAVSKIIEGDTGLEVPGTDHVLTHADLAALFGVKLDKTTSNLAAILQDRNWPALKEAIEDRDAIKVIDPAQFGFGDSSIRRLNEERPDIAELFYASVSDIFIDEIDRWMSMTTQYIQQDPQGKRPYTQKLMKQLEDLHTDLDAVLKRAGAENENFIIVADAEKGISRKEAEEEFFRREKKGEKVMLVVKGGRGESRVEMTSDPLLDGFKALTEKYNSAMVLSGVNAMVMGYGTEFAVDASGNVHPVDGRGGGGITTTEHQDIVTRAILVIRAREAMQEEISVLNRSAEELRLIAGKIEAGEELSPEEQELQGDLSREALEEQARENELEALRKQGSLPELRTLTESKTLESTTGSALLKNIMMRIRDRKTKVAMADLTDRALEIEVGTARDLQEAARPEVEEKSPFEKRMETAAGWISRNIFRRKTEAVPRYEDIGSIEGTGIKVSVMMTDDGKIKISSVMGEREIDAGELKQDVWRVVLPNIEVSTDGEGNIVMRRRLEISGASATWSPTATALLGLSTTAIDPSSLKKYKFKEMEERDFSVTTVENNVKKQQGKTAQREQFLIRMKGKAKDTLSHIKDAAQGSLNAMRSAVVFLGVDKNDFTGFVNDVQQGRTRIEVGVMVAAAFIVKHALEKLGEDSKNLGYARDEMRRARDMLESALPEEVGTGMKETVREFFSGIEELAAIKDKNVASQKLRALRERSEKLEEQATEEETERLKTLPAPPQGSKGYVFTIDEVIPPALINAVAKVANKKEWGRPSLIVVNNVENAQQGVDFRGAFDLFTFASNRTLREIVQMLGRITRQDSDSGNRYVVMDEAGYDANFEDIDEVIEDISLVMKNMEQQWADSVNNALSSGAITQEQADELKDEGDIKKAVEALNKYRLEGRNALTAEELLLLNAAALMVKFDVTEALLFKMDEELRNHYKAQVKSMIDAIAESPERSAAKRKLIAAYVALENPVTVESKDPADTERALSAKETSVHSGRDRLVGTIKGVLEQAENAMFSVKAHLETARGDGENRSEAETKVEEYLSQIREARELVDSDREITDETQPLMLAESLMDMVRSALSLENMMIGGRQIGSEITPQKQVMEERTPETTELARGQLEREQPTLVDVKAEDGHKVAVEIEGGRVVYSASEKEVPIGSEPDEKGRVMYAGDAKGEVISPDIPAAAGRLLSDIAGGIVLARSSDGTAAALRTDKEGVVTETSDQNVVPVGSNVTADGMVLNDAGQEIARTETIPLSSPTTGKLTSRGRAFWNLVMSLRGLSNEDRAALGMARAPGAPLPPDAQGEEVTFSVNFEDPRDELSSSIEIARWLAASGIEDLSSLPDVTPAMLYSGNILSVANILREYGIPQALSTQGKERLTQSEIKRIAASENPGVELWTFVAAEGNLSDTGREMLDNISPGLLDAALEKADLARRLETLREEKASAVKMAGARLQMAERANKVAKWFTKIRVGLGMRFRFDRKIERLEKKIADLTARMAELKAPGMDIRVEAASASSVLTKDQAAAELGKAQEAFDTGQYREASRILDDAIAADPSNGKAYLLYSRILNARAGDMPEGSARRRQVERALRFAEVAISLDKKDASAAEEKINLLDELGRSRDIPDAAAGFIPRFQDMGRSAILLKIASAAVESGDQDTAIGIYSRMSRSLSGEPKAEALAGAARAMRMKKIASDKRRQEETAAREKERGEKARAMAEQPLGKQLWAQTRETFGKLSGHGGVPLEHRAQRMASNILKYGGMAGGLAIATVGVMNVGWISGLMAVASITARWTISVKALEFLNRKLPGWAKRVSAYYSERGLDRRAAEQADSALAVPELTAGRRMELLSLMAGSDIPGTEAMTEKLKALLDDDQADLSTRQRAEGYTRLSELYRSTEQASEAEAALKSARAIDPSYSPAVIALADLTADDAPEMIPALEESLEKDPGNPELIARLSEAYISGGRIIEASQILAGPLRQEPDNARLARSAEKIISLAAGSFAEDTELYAGVMANILTILSVTDNYALASGIIETVASSKAPHLDAYSRTLMALMRATGLNSYQKRDLISALTSAAVDRPLTRRQYAELDRAYDSAIEESKNNRERKALDEARLASRESYAKNFPKVAVIGMVGVDDEKLAEAREKHPDMEFVAMARADTEDAMAGELADVEGPTTKILVDMSPEEALANIDKIVLQAQRQSFMLMYPYLAGIDAARAGSMTDDELEEAVNIVKMTIPEERPLGDDILEGLVKAHASGTEPGDLSEGVAPSAEEKWVQTGVEAARKLHSGSAAVRENSQRVLLGMHAAMVKELRGKTPETAVDVLKRHRDKSMAWAFAPESEQDVIDARAEGLRLLQQTKAAETPELRKEYASQAVLELTRARNMLSSKPDPRASPLLARIESMRKTLADTEKMTPQDKAAFVEEQLKRFDGVPEGRLDNIRRMIERQMEPDNIRASILRAEKDIEDITASTRDELARVEMDIAAAHMENEDTRRALLSITRAEKLDPKLTSSLKTMRAEVLVRDGDRQWNAGNTSAAMSAYGRAFRYDIGHFLLTPASAPGVSREKVAFVGRLLARAGSLLSRDNDGLVSPEDLAQGSSIITFVLKLNIIDASIGDRLSDMVGELREAASRQRDQGYSQENYKLSRSMLALAQKIVTGFPEISAEREYQISRALRSDLRQTRSALRAMSREEKTALIKQEVDGRLARDKITGAIRYLNMMRRENPGMAAVINGFLADVYVIKGRGLAETGRFKEAISAYDKAIALNAGIETPGYAFMELALASEPGVASTEPAAVDVPDTSLITRVPGIILSSLKGLVARVVTAGAVVAFLGVVGPAQAMGESSASYAQAASSPAGIIGVAIAGAVITGLIIAGSIMVRGIRTREIATKHLKASEILASILRQGILGAGELERRGITAMRSPDERLGLDEGAIAVISEVMDRTEFYASMSEKYPQWYQTLAPGEIEQEYTAYLAEVANELTYGEDADRSPIYVTAEREEEVGVERNIDRYGKDTVEERLQSTALVLMRTTESVDELRDRATQKVDSRGLTLAFESLPADSIEAIFVTEQLYPAMTRTMPAELLQKVKLVNVEIGPEAVQRGTASSLRMPEWQKALGEHLSAADISGQETFMLHGVRLPTEDEAEIAPIRPQELTEEITDRSLIPETIHNVSEEWLFSSGQKFIKGSWTMHRFYQKGFLPGVTALFMTWGVYMTTNIVSGSFSTTETLVASALFVVALMTTLAILAQDILAGLIVRLAGMAYISKGYEEGDVEARLDEIIGSLENRAATDPDLKEALGSVKGIALSGNYINMLYGGKAIDPDSGERYVVLTPEMVMFFPKVAAYRIVRSSFGHRYNRDCQRMLEGYPEEYRERIDNMYRQLWRGYGASAGKRYIGFYRPLAFYTHLAATGDILAANRYRKKVNRGDFRNSPLRYMFDAEYRKFRDVQRAAYNEWAEIFAPEAVKAEDTTGWKDVTGAYSTDQLKERVLSGSPENFKISEERYTPLNIITHNIENIHNIWVSGITSRREKILTMISVGLIGISLSVNTISGIGANPIIRLLMAVPGIIGSLLVMRSGLSQNLASFVFSLTGGMTPSMFDKYDRDGKLTEAAILTRGISHAPALALAIFAFSASSSSLILSVLAVVPSVFMLYTPVMNTMRRISTGKINYIDAHEWLHAYQFSIMKDSENRGLINARDFYVANMAAIESKVTGYNSEQITEAVLEDIKTHTLGLIEQYRLARMREGVAEDLTAMDVLPGLSTEMMGRYLMDAYGSLAATEEGRAELDGFLAALEKAPDARSAMDALLALMAAGNVIGMPMVTAYDATDFTPGNFGKPDDACMITPSVIRDISAQSLKIKDADGNPVLKALILVPDKDEFVNAMMEQGIDITGIEVKALVSGQTPVESIREGIREMDIEDLRQSAVAIALRVKDMNGSDSVARFYEGLDHDDRNNILLVESDVKGEIATTNVLTVIEAMLGQTDPMVGLVGENPSLLAPFRGIFARFFKILPLDINGEISNFMNAISEIARSL
jgi:tetratricopeptide (TPR) repeat protein/Fe2+ or Zn2+ uptake regulation protein